MDVEWRQKDGLNPLWPVNKRVSVLLKALDHVIA
jgi:hypothetical protein